MHCLLLKLQGPCAGRCGCSCVDVLWLQVAASKASTIIVLHPEGTSSGNAEAIKVSVAMSLTALGGTGSQRVVVQGPSAGTSTILSSLEATTRQAGGHSTIQAFELPDTQLTHRLVSSSGHRHCTCQAPGAINLLSCLSGAGRWSHRSGKALHAANIKELQPPGMLTPVLYACAGLCVQVAQTAAQPGILTCWLDLLALTSSSAEFYCAPIPSVLRGKPYVELRR
jgi:hypothetical protein